MRRRGRAAEPRQRVAHGALTRIARGAFVALVAVDLFLVMQVFDRSRDARLDPASAGPGEALGYPLGGTVEIEASLVPSVELEGGVSGRDARHDRAPTETGKARPADISREEPGRAVNESSETSEMSGSGSNSSGTAGSGSDSTGDGSGGGGDGSGGDGSGGGGSGGGSDPDDGDGTSGGGGGGGGDAGGTGGDGGGTGGGGGGGGAG